MRLIQTTHGAVDEALLEMKTGTIDNDDEYTTWVEYWLDGELVHRSVHVTLKKWPDGLSGIAQSLTQENI